MRPVIQISALLIVAGLALYFALGTLLYSNGNYELLALELVCTGLVILFGGFQCWLIPRAPKRYSSSLPLGFRVCGITSLFVFGFINIFLLSLIFFKLEVNSPYRVNYDIVDVASSKLQAAALPNGVHYSVTHANYKRDKFSVVLRVNVGTFHEGDGSIGISHLAEHISLDSTVNQPGRHGVLAQFQALGAKIHTYTSHRATFFIVNDIPYSSSELNNTLFLLRDLALAQTVAETELELEKKVLLGEERLFNSTTALLRRRVYCNHFGAKHQVCQRFPYHGSDVPSLTSSQVHNFLDTWYHPKRMQVYLAGDFDSIEATHAVRRAWGSASRAITSESPPEPAFASTLPGAIPLTIESITGVEGIDLNLLVGVPYHNSRTTNHHRHRILNRLFYGVILNQYMSRMGDYDYTRDEIFSNIHLYASVRDRYELNQTMHSLQLRIGGHPEKGSWKSYLEVFFEELRRLAVHGPSYSLVTQLLETARLVLRSRKAFSAFDDSGSTIYRMIGNADPEFTYLDSAQQYELLSPFLNRGFLKSAALHVQAEAQFLWRGVIQCVNNTDKLLGPAMSGLVLSTASLSIFTDAKLPSKNSVGPADSTPQSYVGKRDLAMLLNKVLDATLVPAPSSLKPSIKLEDVFTDTRDLDLWDRALYVSSLSAVYPCPSSSFAS